jgi:rare lipoprotein A
MSGRVADLSMETATVLGFADAGTAHIKIAYVGPAPLEGDDSKMLMASLSTSPVPTTAPQILVADAQPARPTGPQNRNPFQGGAIGSLITSLLGYTDADTNVNAAVAAATAMATRTPALDDWKDSVDDDARKIQLQLGIFADSGRAQTVATDFALLGAVDEDSVDDGGQSATRLTLTHLKPGVSRGDVVKLAQQLGLNGAVLY